MFLFLCYLYYNKQTDICQCFFYFFLYFLGYFYIESIYYNCLNYFILFTVYILIIRQIFRILFQKHLLLKNTPYVFHPVSILSL